jgi:hypothetical protein
LRRLLVDIDAKPGTMQRQRRGETAYAAADDRDLAHRCRHHVSQGMPAAHVNRA